MSRFATGAFSDDLDLPGEPVDPPIVAYRVLLVHPTYHKAIAEYFCPPCAETLQVNDPEDPDMRVIRFGELDRHESCAECGRRIA